MAPKISGQALAAKYYGFSHPCIQVSVGGRKIQPEESGYLERAEITATVGREPDMAVLVYHIGKLPAESLKRLEGTLQVGEKLEIRAGYADCVDLIFLGYVHTVEVCDYGREFLEYTIVGLDAKGLMKKNSRYASSGTQKAEQLLQEILSGENLARLIPEKEINALPECMSRECWIRGETDYEWVCRLAEYLNYEFFGSRGKIFFRKAGGGTGELTELKEEYGLMSVSAQTSLEVCSGSVQICGYNRKDEKISGVFDFPELEGPFGGGMKETLKKCRVTKWEMELETAEQAVFRAKAAMMATARGCCRMEAVNMGLPELQPGEYVRITNESADSLSGIVYSEEVSHLFDSKGYRTALRGTLKGFFR